jgi:hypothetical protein
MELRSMATTAWLAPLAAILPQTSQVLLSVCYTSTGSLDFVYT